MTDYSQLEILNVIFDNNDWLFKFLAKAIADCNRESGLKPSPIDSKKYFLRFNLRFNPLHPKLGFRHVIKIDITCFPCVFSGKFYF